MERAAQVRPAAHAAPIVLLALVAVSALGCASRHEPPADLILENGAVVTLDPSHPEARAVAVRGGSIVAVGGEESVRAFAGPRTRRIDLHGAMVLPGLSDAHGHVRSLGDRLSSLDLRGVTGVDEVARRVRERAGDLPAGAWVTGGGWDQNLWPGRTFPDHRPLTAAAPDRPVFLTRVDGHAAWLNRKALEAAGITRATKDPEGGTIDRDARGEPTGVLVDNAVDLARAAQPPPSRESIRASIGRALRRCAESGLTEVHDASVSEEVVEVYREMADAGELPLRVYLMWDGTGLGAHLPGRSGSETPIEPMLAHPPLINYRDRLTVRALKLMIDGAMGSRGALFFEDYADAPGRRGLPVTPPEEIERATELALRRGYQVCTHAIGDRAIRLTLDAYEKALANVPAADPRLRIEHLQCVAREDVPRLKRLGVIASMQPSHATSDMPWAEDRVGPDRGRGLYAWRWVLDAGIVIAAGSDFPVDPERPLVGLHSAVTRQDLEGKPAGGWHPEQRMTLEEALAAYTRGAAYAAFEENRRGRIAPGYDADLTVLSRDLRAIPPAEIAQAEVLRTVVGGRIAFEKP
jgi:predicted amidohydrolase YtcJ